MNSAPAGKSAPAGPPAESKAGVWPTASIQARLNQLKVCTRGVTLFKEFALGHFFTVPQTEEQQDTDLFHKCQHSFCQEEEKWNLSFGNELFFCVQLNLKKLRQRFWVTSYQICEWLFGSNRKLINIYVGNAGLSNPAAVKQFADDCVEYSSTVDWSGLQSGTFFFTCLLWSFLSENVHLGQRYKQTTNTVLLSAHISVCVLKPVF